MFFKKDKKLESCKCDNYVECDECKSLINKSYAQVVSYNDLGIFYYCQRCKKPYSEIFVGSRLSGEFNNQYFKKMEVDEQGEPIGYKKISK